MNEQTNNVTQNVTNNNDQVIDLSKNKESA